jgi:PadR family transcriptional regulator
MRTDLGGGDRSEGRSIYRVTVYVTDVDSMSEQSFLILAALADQPRHGYGLVTEVAAMSENRIQLRASTLYAALERLAARGLVEPERDEVANGRLRRYYRLTDAGAAAVEAETQRMTTQARAARRRLARRTQQSAPRLGLTG